MLLIVELFRRNPYTTLFCDTLHKKNIHKIHRNFFNLMLLKKYLSRYLKVRFFYKDISLEIISFQKIFVFKNT